MSEEEKLQLENECLLKYSKAQMIQKYIDELEENCTLSDLWCKSQEENKRLNNIINKALEKSKGLQYRFGYVLDDLVYLLMQGSDKELQEENKHLHKNYDEIYNICLEYQKEIERLNNIINEFKDWLETKKQFYDTDEEEAIDYYFLYGDVLNQFKGLLGELKGSNNNE